MSLHEALPQSQWKLRDLVAQRAAERLAGTYSSLDVGRLNMAVCCPETQKLRLGVGSAPWAAVSAVLQNLQELVMPGAFVACEPRPSRPTLLSEDIAKVGDTLFPVLLSFFTLGTTESEASEMAANASLLLLERLPEFREHALWNIFASLKDPAVWDSYILDDARYAELGSLDLLDAIDDAIRARDMQRYVAFLRGHRFEYAYDYQRRLVKRVYPGWRALLMHDMAHALARGGDVAEGAAQARPVPFLPRLIAENAGIQYQTDFHPETVIGDANFVEHPHRGITTGQTGRIGIGCVIYPCTMGGITDKVKQRHPMIGNFVVIGTDSNVFGPVKVGDGSVIGPNSEINGFVELGRGVKVRAAVVARTVISSARRPGRLIFEDGVVIGEEALIINDQATDLVIPAGTLIPAHCHIVNDGFGRPKFV